MPPASRPKRQPRPAAIVGRPIPLRPRPQRIQRRDELRRAQPVPVRIARTGVRVRIERPPPRQRLGEHRQPRHQRTVRVHARHRTGPPAGTGPRDDVGATARPINARTGGLARGAAYGSFTYPWRAFHRKYFSNAILAAWDCGPGIITPCLRGGSILSARMTTPLLPASMMHTAGMSPKFSSLVGCSPRICMAMFSAATRAIVSAGNPVFGTPTAFAVVHGALTAAAIPTAYTFGWPSVW